MKFNLTPKSDDDDEWMRLDKKNDRRLTNQTISEELNMKSPSQYSNKLNMTHFFGNICPENLTFDQKTGRMEICQDLLGQIKRDPDVLNNFMSPVDESRVFEYDPEKNGRAKSGTPQTHLVPRK